jgi:GxxExxY protein
MERDPRTAVVLKCAIEVQKTLGAGFLEGAYQEALAFEFEAEGVRFKREAELPLRYKGRVLGNAWKADFIVFDAVVLELKAADALTAAHEAQLLNYLKAGRFEVGLLLNFGQPKLQFKRLVMTHPATR